MQLSGMYMFGVTKDRKPVIDRYTFQGTVKAADGSSFALAGLNQSSYTTEYPSKGYSHADALYMYTSAWLDPDRPSAASYATPTEVLVQNGVVQQVVEGAAFSSKPPKDGYILRAHGKAVQYVRDHLKIGQTVSADYSLQSLTTQQSADPGSFDMMVGGHTILVDNGQASAFSRDISSISGSSARARTAVGYSQDGNSVFLITVEANGSSTGLTLPELQQAMVAMGVYKGVNLDGGGSTTLIDRPLGEFSLQLSHSTEYGTTMRQVSNGLGVFSLAPQGTIKGIKASGAGVLFMGQSALYSLKAYDEYFNPRDGAGLDAQWSSSGVSGAWNGNSFTPSKAGDGTLTVKSGSAVDSIPVTVVGGSGIASMSIGASSAPLEAGTQVSVPITVTLLNGQKYTLPSDSVKWELQGFTASRNGDKLTVGSVTNGASIGYAIARYDGFSALLPFAKNSGSIGLADFDTVKPAYSFSATAGVVGSTNALNGLDASNGTGALGLSYDFSGGTTDTRAAYAMMGNGGVPINGQATAISADVFGDGSLNWVRAEVTDAAGTAHMLTLSKAINWTGWKTLKAILADSGKPVKYPVKLTRLYLVDLKDGSDERAASGQIAFDNVKADVPAAIPTPASVRIEMRAGSKTAFVGGKKVVLDSSLYLKNGITYLPLRFVASSLGSTVNYDAAAKRVSVLRGAKLLEMVIDSTDLIASGQRVAADAAPIERGEEL